MDGTDLIGLNEWVMDVRADRLIAQLVIRGIAMRWIIREDSNGIRRHFSGEVHSLSHLCIKNIVTLLHEKSGYSYDSIFMQYCSLLVLIQSMLPERHAY